MPTIRAGFARGVIDGKMYVAGGFGQPGAGVVLQVYDPVLDAWSTLAPMPTSRGDLAGDALGNKLYAVGGVAAPGTPELATVEVYTLGPPVITSPLVAAGTVGQPFVYQFEASGATSLGVSNLPPGLTFNAGLKAITGTPTTTGTFLPGLSATNAAGTTNLTLTVSVQPVPSSGPAIRSSTAVTGRVGRPFSFQVYTTGGTPAARVSATGLPAGLSLEAASGRILGTPVTAGSSTVSLTVMDGPDTTSTTLQLTFTADPGLPVITSPGSGLLTPGQFFSYTISSSSSADPAIFTLIGSLPNGLTFDGVATISGTYTGLVGESGRVGPRTPDLAGGIVLGNIQLFGTNSHGTSTFQLLFRAPPSGAVNIATRLQVGTGEMSSSAVSSLPETLPKVVIIRAIGPSLTNFGVPECVAGSDARDCTIAKASRPNDNWRDHAGTDHLETGLPPADDLESAIVVGLDPGNYTATVRDSNGSTGIALVEVYDLGTASLDASGNARLGNISTRGFVDTGDNVMIGGFIIQRVATRVVVRAIGPSLSTFGISGALPDPTLDAQECEWINFD